jgi:hypothetical protein
MLYNIFELLFNNEPHYGELVYEFSFTLYCSVNWLEYQECALTSISEVISVILG